MLIAIISLGVGVAIGFFAGRSNPLANDYQKRQVDELKSEIHEYKDSVATHFQQTATMINEMNDSYKGVVQHLAKGSQDLCDAGVAKDIESRLIPKINVSKQEIEATSSEQQDQQHQVIEPPRDYAPKQPDELGALSENYGIKVTNINSTGAAQKSQSAPLNASHKA